MSDAAYLSAALPGERRVPWGAVASVGLHGLLALAAIWLTPLRHLVVPLPVPVTVEIVTQAEFAALQPATPEPVREMPAAPPRDALLLPATPVIGSAPPDAPVSGLAPHATHVATAFYSADMLREPSMARIRRTLTSLADSERVVQLCNIEALEQIRRAEPAYAPDTLVAYAMSDMVASGLTLSASGGAFRSRRRWYGISLQCTVAADYQGVTAFAFTLGEPIPEAEWDRHSLTAEDADE